MGFWSSMGSMFSSTGKSSNKPEEDSVYKQHVKAILDFELKPLKPADRNTQKDGDENALSSGVQDEQKQEAAELDDIEGADDVAKHFHKALPPSGVRVKKN